MPEIDYSSLFFVIPAVILLVLLFLLRWMLKRTEKKRYIDIIEDDYDAAVPTTTPHTRPQKKARETRKRSVRSRFSIIRRITTIGMIAIIGIIAIFPMLDHIPAALFSVIIASSGVLIGIASRPFIENLIAGVVITFSRHLRIGDTVQIDEHYGTIEDITLIYTVIKSWDWRRYIVPNSHMLAKEFVSLSLNDTFRWAYVEFWVEPAADLEQIKEEAVKMAAACEHFSPREDPSFWVMQLDKEGTCCWLAAWADSPGEAWMLSSEMRTGLAKQLHVRRIKRHQFNVENSATPGNFPPPLHERKSGPDNLNATEREAAF
jgi:small-conductance mechanosensitive channel